MAVAEAAAEASAVAEAATAPVGAGLAGAGAGAAGAGSADNNGAERLSGPLAVVLAAAAAFPAVFGLFLNLLVNLPHAFLAPPPSFLKNLFT